MLDHIAEQGARRAREFRRAYGTWLKQHVWSHWVTLTTGRLFAAERLLHAFQDEYIRGLAKVTQHAVPYFFVIEGGALGDRPHLHALIAQTSALDCTRLESAWRHGRARVAIFDARQRAADYMVKEVGANVIDYGPSPTRWQPIVDRASLRLAIAVEPQIVPSVGLVAVEENSVQRRHEDHAREHPRTHGRGSV